MEQNTTRPTFKTIYAVIGIVAVLFLWSLSSYNGLVKSNIAVDTQWAQVENQYQRRLDLIPNLVSSVLGALKQEQAIFGQIALARQGYAGARTTDEKVAAANQVESSLGRLLMITENYPVLKSSEQFNGLIAELSGTENRVAVERGRFNESVSSYNMRTKTFPGNLFAGIFGFKERPLFKATTGAEVAPRVDFTK